MTIDDDASETRPETPHAVNPRWRLMLEGGDPSFGRGRGVFRRLPSSPRCKMCAAPFAGPAAPVMRMMDRAPWAKNPSICGLCFKELERAHGGAEIELSMLFADVRGSTGIAEGMDPTAFRSLLDRFYLKATNVLVGHDAVVDKFVGDEVVALFIPALAGVDHARQAIDAARDLLRATGHQGTGEPWVPLGVGVHTGVAYVGTVGDTVTDFTALGDNVNVTARLASAAGAGEILVSAATAAAADLEGSFEVRNLTLRGRTQPLEVRVLRV